jgi:hypothetical protein
MPDLNFFVGRFYKDNSCMTDGNDFLINNFQNKTIQLKGECLVSNDIVGYDIIYNGNYNYICRLISHKNGIFA